MGYLVHWVDNGNGNNPIELLWIIAPVTQMRDGNALKARERIEVLYFTAVPLAAASHGGMICCRNHVRRLAADPKLEVTVVPCGPSQQRDATQAFVETVGADCHFIDFKEPRDPTRFTWIGLRHWPILREAEAMAQPHVEDEVLELLHRTRPQIVIVDYVPSALFVKAVYKTSVRRITVTLNSEAAFFREIRAQNCVPPSASATWFANLRAAYFEQSIYRRSHAVVALTANDLPHGRSTRVNRVIPPALDARQPGWRYAGTSRQLFVGNIAHWPNRLVSGGVNPRLNGAS